MVEHWSIQVPICKDNINIKSISCNALYEEMPVPLSPSNFSPATLSKQFVKATLYVLTHK